MAPMICRHFAPGFNRGCELSSHIRAPLDCGRRVAGCRYDPDPARDASERQADAEARFLWGSDHAD